MKAFVLMIDAENSTRSEAAPHRVILASSEAEAFEKARFTDVVLGLPPSSYWFIEEFPLIE